MKPSRFSEEQIIGMLKERIPTPRAALRWVMQIVEHCTYGQSYEQDFRSA